MKTTGRVNGIISNIVIVKADGPVGQNEICHVYCGDTKMMAEVIKVVGDNAYVQVFDSTRGLKIGEKVEFEGHMLEATLAPGLLSRNYDGLQNDLEKMDGLFIARGSITDPIDFEKKWEFKPLAKPGDKVSAASWLGQVKEEWVEHKIMVPFTMEGTYTVKSVVPAGEYKVTDTIAVITDADGRDHDITMVQRWPVKQAVRCYREKPRPSRVMETGVRAIDTFNPLAEGGTGFIPGPFGAGKTVLQHAISKQADADVIIIVACGERANEVVEIFKEFPELVDPRTGHKLMERTIIICNTSNMPVAAREASVYTGMTIGEYYRSMGLKVLVMADSTSRRSKDSKDIAFLAFYRLIRSGASSPHSTVQSVSEPARWMTFSRQSSKTAMNVATISLRLRLPRNSSLKRVMPNSLSRCRISSALPLTGYGSRRTISLSAALGGAASFSPRSMIVCMASTRSAFSWLYS